MRLLIFAFIILLTKLSFAQQRKVDHEWFNYSFSGTYSVEDGFIGLNSKLSLPMQKGFNFVIQGTAFPKQFNNELDEFRYLFNVELVPYHGRFFGFYFQTGLDEGFWKRTANIENYQPTISGFIKDNSIMFGGGFEIINGRFSLVFDHKYYPEINRNHVSIGCKVLFFEDKRIRKRYFDYIYRRKIKSKKSKRSNL